MIKWSRQITITARQLPAKVVRERVVFEGVRGELVLEEISKGVICQQSDGLYKYNVLWRLMVSSGLWGTNKFSCSDRWLEMLESWNEFLKTKPRMSLILLNIYQQCRGVISRRFYLLVIGIHIRKICKWEGSWTRARICKLLPMARSSSRLVFVNKVLLEPCHIHSLMYCLGCFHAAMAELNATETIWPTKPKIFTFWTSKEKFPRPELKRRKPVWI